MAGEVIGINSIKVAQVGVEGMGYSISTQGAIPLINDLITVGYVVRPWLGVVLYQVDEYAVSQLDLSVNEGILLREIVQDSPAYKSGLRKYDVITSFDGKQVTTIEELVKEIRSRQVGETVNITYWRGDSRNTVLLTLEQSPPE
jgi:serine protease Do